MQISHAWANITYQTTWNLNPIFPIQNSTRANKPNQMDPTSHHNWAPLHVSRQTNPQAKNPHFTPSFFLSNSINSKTDPFMYSIISPISVVREREREMLGVFSKAVMTPPDELVAAGSRTPSPKTKARTLVDRFLERTSSAVSVQIGDDGYMAFTHHNESALQPR